MDDYLAHASFLPLHLESTMTPVQSAGRAWLQAHSGPCDRLTTMQVEAFAARFEVNQRDTSKRVGVTTIVRFMQPLKSCWAQAVARDDVLVERNPFVAVKPPRKVKGKTSASKASAVLAVDADLVIDVPQAIALAEACGQRGTWGAVVDCFILVAALCGLCAGRGRRIVVGGR